VISCLHVCVSLHHSSLYNAYRSYPVSLSRRSRAVSLLLTFHTDPQSYDESTTKVIYNRKSRLTTLWETSPRTPASRSRCAFSFSFLHLSPEAQRLGRIPSILFRLSFFSFVHLFTLSCLLEGNRRSKEGKLRNLRLEQGREE